MISSKSIYNGKTVYRLASIIIIYIWDKAAFHFEHDRDQLVI